MATEILKLTKKAVDGLDLSEEGEGRRRYKDEKLPGFFLRVGQKTKIYFIEKKNQWEAGENHHRSAWTSDCGTS